MSSKPSKLVIAAIDFGTTYSGYAYSFIHNLKKDPLQVYTNIWTDENGKLQTEKAPTTVLFNQLGEFDSFGFLAEARYAELADEDKHYGWRYFKHFKMKLHKSSELRRKIRIKDDQGKSMLGEVVFSAAIKYLKEKLFEDIKKRATHMTETDIYWVITVPAIWQYKAKQFMKEASIKAGIPVEQFTFALEPEAAAIYCKQLETSKCGDGESASIKTFSPRSQFMVIDMGGGTVDITVSEVQSDETLKEILCPSGGAWGGTLVDKEIHDFLEQIFSPIFWRSFKEKEKTAYLELLVMIEAKKRMNPTELNNDIRLILPPSLLDLFQKEKGIDFGSYLPKSQFNRMVSLRRGNKLCIKSEEFAKLFDNPKQLILKHLRKIIDLPELKDVSTLMMVGGFSEAHVMHNAVREAFPGKHVIIPEGAGTIVMKGGVLFGFNKKQICSRKMPLSYGIATAVPYDPRVHPPGRSIFNKMEDVFHPFVKKRTRGS